MYEDPLRRDATTIREHIEAFSNHSRFDWYPVNVAFGLPPALARLEFASVVFHYSVRPTYVWLDEAIRHDYFGPNTYKISVFQDEIWHFEQRERFLTELRIDCLYSRHKPHHVRDVYGPHLPVEVFTHYLAGYVSDDLIDRAKRREKPYQERSVDVGYRGRRLPHYFGRGSQEKALIAERFTELTKDMGLCTELATEESNRLYGDDWDQFLANCKAMLGVEGGVSVVDRSGRFRAEYERMIRENPNLTYTEYAAAMGPEFEDMEDRIDYRCLTPRHFESAAFRNLQILFEGRYDGILTPWVHYVPLRKDFSNLSEALAVLADPARAAVITNRAYDDLIGSGIYSYRQFLRSFDERLASSVRMPLGQVPTRLDRELRDFLDEWHRFQSRRFDFAACIHDPVRSLELKAYRRSTSNQFVLNYNRKVRQRLPRPASGFGRWYRQAADRAFWKQAEMCLGAQVPARPEFDRDIKPLTVAERLVTVPGVAARFVGVAVRQLSRYLSRGLRFGRRSEKTVSAGAE